MSKAKTEVAELPKSQLPAEYMAEMEQYAGAGVSDRSEDFALPFLMISQKGSPQVNRREEKYIEGIEVGDIFNTATGEYWRGSEGVAVIQAWFQKAMVEWIPRNDGGGWVATHEIDTPLQNKAKWGGPDSRQLLLPNGHQLVDTSYHFVSLAENGEAAVISMASTSLGCSRSWQTLMKRIRLPNGVVAPCFSRVYRLTTAYKKNEKGDWFVFSVKDEGWSMTEDRYKPGYQSAKAFFIDAHTKGGVTMGKPPESSPGDYEDNVVDVSADAPI